MEQRIEALEKRMDKFDRALNGDAENGRPGIWSMTHSNTQMLERMAPVVEGLKTDRTKLWTMFSMAVTLGGVLGWLLKH